MRLLKALLLLLAMATPGKATDWIRAGLNTNQPVWGIRGHLVWAIAPAGFRANEPRGLIRLGYPVRTNGGYDLINFIAIEPVVGGKKSYSELERSRLDGRPGKRIWAENATNGLASGTLTNAAGSEQLLVRLGVEGFDNDAVVRLEARQRSDWPDELELTVYREEKSAPIEQCVLTATMGNMARTRQLWLKDEVISSFALYKDYRGNGFAEHKFFPVARLERLDNGDALVAITTDESDPSLARLPARSFWNYRGRKVTQYWRVPSEQLDRSIEVAVNGRYTYWGSRRPIPGGVAFENFEMRRPFRDGQQFVFGITAKTPQELGFKVAR